MTLPQKTKAFLARHKKALLFATAAYLLVLVMLVGFSTGPQTESFVYHVR